MAKVEIPFQTEQEQVQYAGWLSTFFDNPLEWVYACYPWQEAGTMLANETGPDKWQRDFLNEIGAQVRGQEAIIRMGASSGHGSGKSALVAWLIHWFESTRHNAQMVVTANTATQLKTKTWRELAKWHPLAINSWMFEWSATAYKCVLAPETWYAAAIPWSEHNSEAFAGLHETHVAMIFDESSGIADVIYEVAEGAMTTPGAQFYQFGNCTKNTGRFYQSMFGRHKHRWTRFVVDTREAKKRNDALLKQWEEDWGVDSDYFRVRVRGLPPKHGSLQFIANGIVDAAVHRVIPDEEVGMHFPLVMGVDVARQGDDESVIVMRRGRKMDKKIVKLQIRNTFHLSQVVNELIIKHRPDAVFVDGVGIGAGVVDTLISKFGHGHIIEVQAGSRPNDAQLYLNTRIEMWDKMRQWLEVADIPDDIDLYTHLTTPEYGFERRSEKMKLEAKEDMKRRGESSPDVADALALTFAQNLPVKTGDKFMLDSEEPEYA